ncbi:MAG: hypothetical protein ACJ0Q8_00810 [Candidatus Azotimanducaceae bacterium]
MRVFLLAVMALFASQVALAGHHEESLKLSKRQADAYLTVTSVNVGEDVTTISAMGDMGNYGKVYATYNMSYGPDRKSGKTFGQGRGVMNDEVASGDFVGHWFREGAVVTMHNIVQINDGSQNLDVITFDAAKNELLVKAYILK